MKQSIRLLTYNIHKGVQGLGPFRRLEIHNLRTALHDLAPDIACLQEVRQFNRKEERYFLHWPSEGQADFLAHDAYQAIYHTNAITTHGEHGNAILSRYDVHQHQHEDMSDHRFEQRGLLHAELSLHGIVVHVICVHLGLIRGSRIRQLKQLSHYIQREIDRKHPKAPLIVAGDFNDGESFITPYLSAVGLRSAASKKIATFPSRMALFQLDHIYTRGFVVESFHSVKRRSWAKLSDHLPFIVTCHLEHT